MLYRFPSYCPKNSAKTLQPFTDTFKAYYYHFYDNLPESEDVNQVQSKLDLCRNNVLIPPISGDDGPDIPMFMKEGLELHEKYLHLRNDESVVLEPKNNLTSLNQIYLFIDSMRPDFPNHLALLVRLLFYLNISNNPSDSFNLSELEYSDLARHKEIMTNAVVLLILLYFKFSKRYRTAVFTRHVRI